MMHCCSKEFQILYRKFMDVALTLRLVGRMTNQLDFEKSLEISPGLRWFHLMP